jgi:competence protein ComEC
MWKRPYWVIALYLFLSGIAYADTVTPSERVINSVIVREGSSSSSIEVGRLSPGQTAIYIGDAPHRYRVRLPNGITGYVAKAWTKRIAATNGRLAIHFIDVGQGDSTLIACPNGRNILVDIGSVSEGDEDAIRDYILGQLDQTSRHIDDLVITHADTDHYNLIAEVLRGVDVGHIYRVGEIEDYRTKFQTWLRNVNPSKISILSENDYDPIPQPNVGLDCGDAKVWILAAAITATKSKKNAMSVVLMVRYGDFEVILTGDATRATEQVIMDRYPAGWLNVDVLKIGHHGSLSTSTGQDWADTLKPEVAVSSSAFQNGHGHPRKEVFERLDDHTKTTTPHLIRHAVGKRPNYTFVTEQNYSEAIYSTAVSGNVVVRSSGTGYTVETVHHK